MLQKVTQSDEIPIAHLISHSIQLYNSFGLLFQDQHHKYMYMLSTCLVLAAAAATAL